MVQIHLSVWISYNQENLNHSFSILRNFLGPNSETVAVTQQSPFQLFGQTKTKALIHFPWTPSHNNTIICGTNDYAVTTDRTPKTWFCPALGSKI